VLSRCALRISLFAAATLVCLEVGWALENEESRATVGLPEPFTGAWGFVGGIECPAEDQPLLEALSYGSVSVVITTHEVKWLDSTCYPQEVTPTGEQFHIRLMCEYDDGSSPETQKWGLSRLIDGSKPLLVIDTGTSYEALEKCRSID
jgi:hypothetical protein